MSTSESNSVSANDGRIVEIFSDYRVMECGWRLIAVIKRRGQVWEHQFPRLFDHEPAARHITDAYIEALSMKLQEIPHEPA